MRSDRVLPIYGSGPVGSEGQTLLDGIPEKRTTRDGLEGEVLAGCA